MPIEAGPLRHTVTSGHYAAKGDETGSLRPDIRELDPITAKRSMQLKSVRHAWRTQASRIEPIAEERGDSAGRMCSRSMPPNRFSKALFEFGRHID